MSRYQYFEDSWSQEEDPFRDAGTFREANPFIDSDPFSEGSLNPSHSAESSPYSASSTTHLSALPRATEIHTRSRSVWRRPLLRLMRRMLGLVVFAVVGALIYQSWWPGVSDITIPHLPPVGIDISEPDGGSGDSVDTSVPSTLPRDEPTATPGEQVSEDAGYIFLSLTDEGIPLLYSSCVLLTVSMDPEGMPEGGEAPVVWAVDEVAELTGLELSYLGLVAHEDSDATIKVTWESSADNNELTGDTLGLGGSPGLILANSGLGYLNEGEVELRSDPKLALGPAADPDLWSMVVLHELGHVLGLGHVEDETSLMAPRVSGELNDGDRRGFAAVGQGWCWERHGI